MSSEAVVGEMTPPRRNGELVFEAPWQSRAFGLAVALYEHGAYDWDSFRGGLVQEIRGHEPDDGGRYYEHWLAAFERLLIERALVTPEEVEARAARLAREDLS